jgi:V/A-type H+-transporting ATPase subunit D
MTQLRMTKAALATRRRDLAAYDRALPSLDLKRQQLLIDLTAERAAAAREDGAIAALTARAGAIRFAADMRVGLESLLAIRAVARGGEVRLGTPLPTLGAIDWAPIALSDAYPPWVHAALDTARGLAEARLRRDVALARAARLDAALRKTIQRINLLQQVLMPQARRDIARIAAFLADGQRMAVARTKLIVAHRTTGRPGAAS